MDTDVSEVDYCGVVREKNEGLHRANKGITEKEKAYEIQ